MRPEFETSICAHNSFRERKLHHHFVGPTEFLNSWVLLLTHRFFMVHTNWSSSHSACSDTSGRNALEKSCFTQQVVNRFAARNRDLQFKFCVLLCDRRRSRGLGLQACRAFPFNAPPQFAPQAQFWNLFQNYRWRQPHPHSTCGCRGTSPNSILALLLRIYSKFCGLLTHHNSHLGVAELEVSAGDGCFAQRPRLRADHSPATSNPHLEAAFLRISTTSNSHFVLLNKSKKNHKNSLSLFVNYDTTKWQHQQETASIDARARYVPGLCNECWKLLLKLKLIASVHLWCLQETWDIHGVTSLRIARAHSLELGARRSRRAAARAALTAPSCAAAPSRCCCAASWRAVPCAAAASVGCSLSWMDVASSPTSFWELENQYEAQNLFNRSSFVSFDWVKIFDGSFCYCMDKSLIFTDPHYHISEKTVVTSVI